MWYKKSHPFTGGLVFTVVIGLATGLIVSIGSRADVIEMLPASCQDRVVSLHVSNTCPSGTYLEFVSDDDEHGGSYIICHCKQPLPPVYMVPNLGQQRIPSTPDSRRPISL